MDTETAIQSQIEPKLIDAFGRQLANSLLTRATLCYVTAHGGEETRYEAFVHAICSDERLVQSWGTSEAAEQEKSWRALIGPEPRSDNSEPEEGDVE